MPQPVSVRTSMMPDTIRQQNDHGGAIFIAKIHHVFTRHDRNYCIFSLNNSADIFIYFSHVSHLLRSLFFGKDILQRLHELLDNDDICIECGLGVAIRGGISLDGNDCVAFNCSERRANRIVLCLKDHLGDRGFWVEPF